MTTTMWQSQLMRKGDLTLVAGLSGPEAERVVLLLSAMGVDFEAEPGASGAISVNVTAADADRARALLKEEYPLGLARSSSLAPEYARDPFADAEVLAPTGGLAAGQSR